MSRISKNLWADTNKVLVGITLTVAFIFVFVYIPSLFAKELKVYKADPLTGVRSPFPSKVIQVEKGTVKVYGTTSGVKNPFPSTEATINSPAPTYSIPSNVLPRGTVQVSPPRNYISDWAK